MGPENKSNRIYLFDNLKFFLIATVVVGHFADEAYGKSGFFKMIFMFIYAFHMPLFLFCSGLFHSNKDVFIKAFKYIGVGYAAKIVMSLSRLMLSGRMSFRLLEDTELPWYMFVMAIYIVATYLLRNVDKRYLLAFAVVTALFAGYDKNVGDYLYLSRAIVFYPFYLCGQMVTKKDIIRLNRSKPLKAAAAVILAGWLVLCLVRTDLVTALRPLFTGRNSYAVAEMFVKWGFLYRALCYAITLLISVSVICLMPDKRLPLITDFGSRTLQVYYWHYPVIRVLQKLGVQAALMGSVAGKISWVLIGVVLTFILSLKPFSFPVKQIFRYCRLVPDKPVMAETK